MSIRGDYHMMSETLVAVQKMQDYIEEHLENNPTISDLSKVSLYSPWYSYRIFKEYTGYTPSRYMRRLKLSRSALKLRDSDKSVTEIAFEAGFQSLEGYQRAFFKEFGCNPHEYAKHPIPLYLFIPYGVIYSQMNKQNINSQKEKQVIVKEIHRPKRKAIIKRGIQADDYFTYCEEVGCDVWGLLMSMHSLLGEPICMWLPQEYKLPMTSEYVQGIEVPLDYDDLIPEGFDIITLPEADYLLFQGEPFEEINYCEAIKRVQEEINQFDPTAKGYMWDNTNPRIQLEPIATRGYIEMVAVKK